MLFCCFSGPGYLCPYMSPCRAPVRVYRGLSCYLAKWQVLEMLHDAASLRARKMMCCAHHLLRHLLFSCFATPSYLWPYRSPCRAPGNPFRCPSAVPVQVPKYLSCYLRYHCAHAEMMLLRNIIFAHLLFSCFSAPSYLWPYMSPCRAPVRVYRGAELLPDQVAST